MEIFGTILTIMAGLVALGVLKLMYSSHQRKVEAALLILAMSAMFCWQTAASGANGEISFEKFRMLSTGMTERQVLAKVGPPSSRFVTSCILTPQIVTCPTIWTYLLGDGWTADLTFSTGRLVDIRNTKTP